MAEGNPRDLFKPVMQLSSDDRIRYALNPLNCFAAAAQIRSQGDRIRAAARELAGGEKATNELIPDLDGVKGVLGPMEGDYRGICGMLAGLANKELAANYTITMPASRLYAEAHFWRSRVLADMLAASSYYKVTAELLSLAMKTLGKYSPSMKAGEIVLLLNHAWALLGDAAKFMGWVRRGRNWGIMTSAGRIWRTP